ncbi:MAG TPA: hypothetical protein VJ817_10620, partial [Gemmatimonadales bacterium]|nr:hypothetical protein [Gemmatimonadales bacterium]
GEKLIVWHGNGPWIETVLMRDPIDHRWPKPHKDVLAQSIHYRVPVERFDDLVEYDGSIIAERTRGTLSARCDKEEMNYLAINLANDVATGKKTVAQARQAYVEAVMAFMKGEKPEYTTGLRFSVASGGTGDPDQPESKIGAQ